MATKMRREEAINKVRQMSLPKETMEIFEALAPELAESEDERIRKALIEVFKKKLEKGFEWVEYGIPNRSVLDWLEKQKECVSNNFDDVWDEEDCEEIIAEGQKLTPRFKELLKEVCHAWYDRGAKLEKQKEQKPVDLSDMMVHKEPYIAPVPTPMVADEQKPTEWSEEDEDNLCRVIRVLEDNDSDWKELSNWLKSLRPSWKPSEEQMKALLNAEGFLRAGLQHDSAKTIAELYEELKKL